MFLKMVKHEFRASYRALIPLFCGLLLMAGLARLSIFLIDKTDFILVQLFGTLFIGLFVLACVASVVLTMVLMMVRFAKSVHGDEGYLTNTLPVGTHTILLSRLLVSFVALLCAYAALFLGYKICTVGLDGVRDFEKMLESIFGQMGEEGTWILVRLAGTALIGIISNILMIFAAISIGHSFPNKKVGLSVLFYFVLYFAAQTVSVIGIFVLSAIVRLRMDELQVANNVSSIMTVFSLVMSAIFCVVYYFLTWIMMKKRLNLS